MSRAGVGRHLCVMREDAGVVDQFPFVDVTVRHVLQTHEEEFERLAVGGGEEFSDRSHISLLLGSVSATGVPSSNAGSGGPFRAPAVCRSTAGFAGRLTRSPEKDDAQARVGTRQFISETRHPVFTASLYALLVMVHVAAGALLIGGGVSGAMLRTRMKQAPSGQSLGMWLDFGRQSSQANPIFGVTRARHWRVSRVHRLVDRHLVCRGRGTVGDGLRTGGRRHQAVRRSRWARRWDGRRAS